MEHELKSDPDCFAASIEGRKPFEVRVNDRNFNVGDTITLRETRWTAEAMAREGKPLVYTGRSLCREILYMLRGPRFGVAAGWCVMTLAEIVLVGKDGVKGEVRLVGNLSRSSMSLVLPGGNSIEFDVATSQNLREQLLKGELAILSAGAAVPRALVS
jgi:hypothetical protein